MLYQYYSCLLSWTTVQITTCTRYIRIAGTPDIRMISWFMCFSRKKKRSGVRAFSSHAGDWAKSQVHIFYPTFSSLKQPVCGTESFWERYTHCNKCQKRLFHNSLPWVHKRTHVKFSTAEVNVSRVFILWHIIYYFWICTYFYTDTILQKRLVVLAYKLISLSFNKRLLGHVNFGILFIASVDLFILDQRNSF